MIHLDLVFDNLAKAAQQIFHRGRINVHAPHDEHVVGAAQDAARQGEVVAATGAGRIGR